MTESTRTYPRAPSDAIDISLDAFSVILTTLRDASKITSVPLLSTAAAIAVNIIGVAQTTRRNKIGFKRLAEDSCELVYTIVLARKDTSNVGIVPDNLTKNLQQLVDTLTSIQKFAERGASRNYFQAVLRSGVDADRIQEYREKLQQSMRVFGIQSDIHLRETVMKLASGQIEMMNKLQNRAYPDSSIASENASSVSSPTSPSVNSRTVGTMTVTENSEMVSGGVTDAIKTNGVLSTGNVAAIGIIFIGITISLYIQFVRGR